VNGSGWVMAGLMALSAGLAGCKSNGAGTASLPSGNVAITASGVPVAGTVAAPPADRTAEFLSAFRPREQP
jgi:hypothetical protein